jgi:biopolymer transport protein TolR
MGMSVGGSSGGPKAEINVTPLVDVVLVLLIIFMVITPMLQRGKSVELPKAREPEKQKKADAQDNALILSVTPDKKLYLENDQLDEKALEDRLREALARDPVRKILLKGDKSLQVGDVRKVMDVARKAQAQSVSLAVEELKSQP